MSKPIQEKGLNMSDFIANQTLPCNKKESVSIIRGKHDRQNPYVMIERSKILDENLSLLAIGILLQILSHPPDWKFSVNEFLKRNNNDEISFNLALKELVDAGHISFGGSNE